VPYSILPPLRACDEQLTEESETSDNLGDALTDALGAFARANAGTISLPQDMLYSDRTLLARKLVGQCTGRNLRSKARSTNHAAATAVILEEPPTSTRLRYNQVLRRR
jgi:hypothetical protein